MELRKLRGQEKCKVWEGALGKTPSSIFFFISKIVFFTIFPGRIYAPQVLGPHAHIASTSKVFMSLGQGSAGWRRGRPPSGLGNYEEGPSSPPHPLLFPRPWQQGNRNSSVVTGLPRLLLGRQASGLQHQACPPIFASAAKPFPCPGSDPTSFSLPSSIHFGGQPGPGQASATS